MHSAKEINRVDGDSPEGNSVTVCLLKQKDNVTMSKLAKSCRDTDILKDTKMLFQVY